MAITEWMYFTYDSCLFMCSTQGKKRSCYVYGNYHLVKNIVILCKKSYVCLLGYYVGLAHSLIVYIFHLGVKEVGDTVEALSQIILEFVEVRQLLRYRDVGKE